MSAAKNLDDVRREHALRAAVHPALATLEAIYTTISDAITIDHALVHDALACTVDDTERRWLVEHLRAGVRSHRIALNGLEKALDALERDDA